MVTQNKPQPDQNLRLVIEKRISKRKRIERMFTDNLGKRFSSVYLHSNFGPAVRTRISDINRDSHSSVLIKNLVEHPDNKGGEASFYWAELRTSVTPDGGR